VSVSGLPVSRLGAAAPVVWGVLNVTPDSFSDGGRFDSIDRALEQAHRMVEQGADVIDIGGESTRPGAQRVDAQEECERVLPVVRALAADGVAVSIDTMRSQVASAALDVGARIVNDVSGGRADERMHQCVASYGVPYVLMHWRGHSASMNELAVYDDPVRQVCEEVRKQVDVALAVGIDESSLILDPGLGFAKESEHNWTLLQHLDTLMGLGYPLLLGPSRKRFLGELLADSEGSPRNTDGRDVATSVLSALFAERGVWGVRVHDVQGTVDAVKVTLAMRSGEDR